MSDDERGKVDFSFAVGGMTCGSCIGFVEKELSQVPGVKYVSVNLANGKAYAVTDGGPDWEDLSAAVTRAGYEPLEEAPGEEETEQTFKEARRRLTMAWTLALPAAVLMVLHMAGFVSVAFMVLEAVAGLAVMLWPAGRIFRGAGNALRHKHANMNVLVSLGSLAAWVTGILALTGFPVLSFAAMAALLPSFHLTGQYIEAKLRRRANVDLRSLLDLGGVKAAELTSDGGIRMVPVESVKVGAGLRVRSGERIPLDGRVIHGKGAVDEAMISGEPIPVLKGPGDEVVGGTVLKSGLLEFEATHTGEDAFSMRMLALVERAQGSKVPIQALADRVSGIFVPIVFSLALLSALAWVLFYPVLGPLLFKVSSLLPWAPAGAGPWTTAVFAMVSLLVVACPCAMGLATPMAVTVGSSLAARRGLLIKGGEAIQRAGELNVLILDKTGTLTEGRPSVSASDLKAEDAAAAAALESLSIHPLAKAVTAWAEAEGLDYTALKPTDVEEIAGEGIRGRVFGSLYEMGRPTSPSTGRRGETVVELRRDGVSVGHLSMSDKVKAEAAEAVAELKRRGLELVMLTGDSEGAARAVAEAAGISNIHFGVRPEGKLKVVQDYQSSGLRVGMIGDGINDAAALKAADVGFALSEGTDLSIEAADLVIVSGGLKRLGEALELSKLTFRTVRNNLFWAFFYNIVAIPLAAAALIHPLLAELAMSLSSIGVVISSMALGRKYKRKLK